MNNLLTGKRKLVVLMIVVLSFLTMVFSGCGNEKTAQNTAKMDKLVRIGTVPLPFYSHMWIAYKKGFLEEELAKADTRLEWKPISLGPVVSESFAAKEIDMGVMGDFPAFNGRAAGIEFAMVSSMKIERAHALLVNPEKGINSVADLKGKKVATTKNTSGYELLIVLLEQAGMTMQDIEFVNMSMADLGTALVKGDVDAGVVWEPSVTRLEGKGMKVITDGAICPNYAVLMGTDELIKKNPKAVNAVLRAYQRGLDYLEKNPEECLGILAKEFNISESELKRMLPKYTFIAPLDDKFKNDMKHTEEFLTKQQILKKPVELDKFIVSAVEEK